MSKSKSPKPVNFQVRPAIRGLNVSDVPQRIDRQESPRLMNVRFHQGLFQTRNGFGLKYKGARESILWIDTIYASGFQNVVAFTRNSAYYEASDILEDIAVYDGNDSVVAVPHFTMDPTSTWLAVEVGNTTISPDCGGDNDMNAGVDFGPDDVMILCNGIDGVLILAYTGQATPVEGQFLHSTWATGCPTFGVACAVYDGRLVIGGTNDGLSVAQWSSKGRFDHWDTGTYSDTGSQVIGDSPDQIIALRRLGDYLICYKQRSTFIGRKSYLADPAIIFEPAPGQGIGIASANSIGDLGEEHIFLGWDDVYSFSLRGVEPIGTRIKDELFYGTDGILPKYLTTCVGVIAEEFDEYWLFVPSGKWPADADYSGSGPDESVENILTNPTMRDDDDDDDPDNWTVSADGNGAVSTVTGGNFGRDATRMTFTTGTYTRLVSNTKDYGAVIHGDTFSVVVWAKASASATMRIKAVTKDGGGANATAQTIYDFTVPLGTTYQAYVFSFVIDDADAEQVYTEVTLRTASVNLDVDAVQTVRMDGISSEYWYGVSGEQQPGFIGPDGVVRAIPFIVDIVGQWMPDTCWVFNYEKNAWSKWRLPMTGFGYDSIQDVVTIGSLSGFISDQKWRFDETRTQELAPTNLIAQPDGQIWEMSTDYVSDFEGLTDDAVLAYWESKDFDLDRPDIDKTFSRLILYHETSHAPVTVTIGISTDSGDTWSQQDITMRSGYTETFVDFFITGNQMRFSIKNDEGFYISGFSVKILPRGESNAY